MKTKKTPIALRRSICVLLAIITVASAMPIFAIEADAASVYTSSEAVFDFNNGTEDSSVSDMRAVGAYADNFVYYSDDSGTSTSTAVYRTDPRDSNNITAGKRSGEKNAQLFIADEGGLMLDSMTEIEARFYIASYTTSSTPLSLIAWNIGSNKPMLRISKDGELDTGNLAGTSVYTKTGKKLELGRWYTVRLEINEVAHEFKLYVDGEYIATQTISDVTKSYRIRFLYNSGAYDAYVDDIEFRRAHPNVTFDFEDGNAGDMLGVSQVSSVSGLTGDAVSDISLYEDPTDPDNLVVGKTPDKNNGCFFVLDDWGALAGSTYSVKLKIYVEAYPVKVSGSGVPLSLFSWNNGGNIPLLRMMDDGELIITKSTNTSSSASNISNYTNSGKRLELGRWYVLRLDVNAVGGSIALYVDGDFICSSGLPKFTASKKLRFFQPNGKWDIYLDDITIRKYIDGESDACIDYEAFGLNKSLTNSLLSASVFPMYAKTGDVSMKTVADPDNPDNIVAFNTGNRFYTSVHNSVVRLPKTEFIASADLRFTEFPKNSDGTYDQSLVWSWVNGSSSPSYYSFFRIDSDGEILDGSKNPVGFKIEKDKWYNMAVRCNGTNGEFTVYIDGKPIHCGDVGTPSASATQSYLRLFYNGADTAVKFSVYADNIMLHENPKEIVTKPLCLSFEGGYLDELARLGEGWKYGTIGTESVQLLGEEGGKYLRVRHGASDENNAYLDVANNEFIGDDTYLIETAFRYSCVAPCGLDVVRIFKSEKEQSALLLGVNGEDNSMFIVLDGVKYGVVDNADIPVAAVRPEDNVFTEAAILVNEADASYTLYVNGRLAYYSRDGQTNPCIDLPICFVSDSAASENDFIRLLEIQKENCAEGVLELEYINVGAMPNGVAAEILGSQTRIVMGTLTYDVRFVSGIDSLYAAKVGYEITIEYGDETRSDDLSSSAVFGSIEADEKRVSAEALGGKYLSVCSICGIDATLEIRITVVPYVDRGGIRVYGESYTATFKDGNIIAR